MIHQPRRDFFRAAARTGLALGLAAAGLPVFPAGPDKRPLLSGWQEKASSEERQIRKWWDSYPTALPAIVVGRSGLVVIDCDRHPGGNDGIKAFNQLVSGKGTKLANVPMTKTARGGAHLFFKIAVFLHTGKLYQAAQRYFAIAAAGGAGF